MDDDLDNAKRALDCIQSQIDPLKQAIEDDNKDGAMICIRCIEIILGDT